ncbi:MAG TPA: hypothetical protein VFI38_16440 [Candidatus Acidoferrum sp.]|nr:hypothetical protein [Candidatus Acidoferrum sp.]
MTQSRAFRYTLPLVAVLFAAVSGPRALGNGPDVLKASRHDVSHPFSQMAIGASSKSGERDTEINAPRPTGALISNPHADPVAAPFAGPISGVSLISNFDGQSAQDNRNLFSFAFVPPDTNGAAGANQFVQIVNVTVAVYDKSSGALQLGPAAIHTLWQGFGGLCEFGGGTPDFADGGDPVVLYDHLAGRWIVTQLQYNTTFTQNAQCIAVSTTSDATGTYNRYEYDFGANFPDYPKFSVWPDAYYNTINVYPGNKFAGPQACAFDRNAMLAGDPANAICFQQPPTISSLLPADLDGRALPPAGSPNYLVGLADSTHLNFYRFHVDFSNPANSSLTGPTLIPVAPYSEICARATTVSCIPEPNPGEKVDGLADRVMFRLAYRNFGDHESLVVNHTILGGPLAGVRWYEIRNPAAPFVYQQSTLVDPDVNYWLGSVAMDKIGNLALGFSASSHNVFPSIYVAARAAGDPAGALSGPLVLVNGSGVQVNSFRRWGDYSSMSVDPVDDCTFWYTQEYYANTGSINWATRISAFKFNSCKGRN